MSMRAARRASDLSATPSSDPPTFPSPDALDSDLERQAAKLDHVSSSVSPSTSDQKPDKDESVSSPEPAKPPQTTLAPEDSSNPRNWSLPKKFLCNTILCIWVLSLTYASTAYVASLGAIEQRYHLGQEASILGVSLTVLGFAAGPLLFGPSSELFGRRPVYVFCGIGFSAFAWGSAFANNAAALLIFRFLLGFFGSASINNVPASIGDTTYPRERGQFNAIYSVGAFLGPALGPLCSSFIESDAGYEWNFRVMAIFATVTSIGAALVPETHGPTLYRRQLAKIAREKEGFELERTPLGAKVSTVVGVYKGALKRPFIFFFTEPIVLFVSIYLSILYGILYGFFEAFGLVYVETRGFSRTSYGLTYVALGLGFIVAATMIATLGSRAYVKQVEKAKLTGEPAPAEARLVLGYAAAIVSPISLFLFAWTAPFPHVHWIVPCLAEFLFSLSMQLIFVSFISYLIDVYTLHAASALAAGMASRALVGGIFPLFAIQMYRALTIQGATSLLAGLALLCTPLPFIFRKVGKGLRLKSKYAQSS
ncbi:hypothetical protein JCM10212_004508 [Sporobolomyces blumeae]